MTLDQAMVGGVLAELGLEHIPGPPGICGGPSQWKVTEATLAHIKAMLGKTITVESNGKTSIK